MSSGRHEDGHDTRRAGVVMIALAWIAVLALLTVVFGDRLAHEENPNRSVDGRIAGDGIREVVLVKNRSGHYVATGAINGTAVTFLLDTGATDVSVPASLAERIGLRAGARMAARTANGVITTYATRLDRVELGPIAIEDVRAHINPHMSGEEVLLGMSFLGVLEFTQRGDSLTLRQSPEA